jgi:hypothetical protein
MQLVNQNLHRFNNKAVPITVKTAGRQAWLFQFEGQFVPNIPVEFGSRLAQARKGYKRCLC